MSSRLKSTGLIRELPHGVVDQLVAVGDDGAAEVEAVGAARQARACGPRSADHFAAGGCGRFALEQREEADAGEVRPAGLDARGLEERRREVFAAR